MSALVDALQQRIDSLEKQLEKKDEQITQVQSTLDKQTLLLEHHQQESSKGIFKKLFGG